MSNLLNKIHKKFALNESINVGINSYIQSLHDVLNTFKPKTIGDSNRVEIAKEHLLNIKRQVRHLQEKITVLEEKISFLEESKKEE